MIKKEIIRCVYGDCSVGQLKLDIDETLNNKFSPPTTVYVWGKNNLDYLTSVGIGKKNKLRLVSENPTEWDMTIGLRHKIESYKIAMFEDGMDEILFLDWDASAQKQIPDSIWSDLGKKHYIQALSYRFANTYAPWRKEGARTSVCTCLFYCRKKEVIMDIIGEWEKFGDKSYMEKWPYSAWAQKFNMQVNDEWPTNKVIDSIHGKWIGSEEWRHFHEIEFVQLNNHSSFGQKPKNKILFRH